MRFWDSVGIRVRVSVRVGVEVRVSVRDTVRVRVELWVGIVLVYG